MSNHTAAKIATLMMGKPVIESTFAGNAVTIIGSDVCKVIVANMNKTGLDIYPEYPSLIIGKGTVVPALNSKKLVIAFETEAGAFDLRITV